MQTVRKFVIIFSLVYISDRIIGFSNALWWLTLGNHIVVPEPIQDITGVGLYTGLSNIPFLLVWIIEYIPYWVPFAFCLITSAIFTRIPRLLRQEDPNITIELLQKFTLLR